MRRSKGGAGAKESGGKILDLLCAASHGVTTYQGRAYDINWAVKMLTDAGAAEPEWIRQGGIDIEHTVPHYDTRMRDITCPVDLGSWAGWCVISTLRRWLDCIQFPAWEERDRPHFFTHAQILAASATLLEWIEDKVSRWVYAEQPVMRGGIVAASWQSWCGRTAQRILPRIFRGGIMKAHHGITRGVYGGCAPVPISLAPSMQVWLGGIADRTVLFEAEQGLRVEWARAWHLVVEEVRGSISAAFPSKPTVAESDALEWRLFLLLHHRECNLSEASRALKASSPRGKCDYGHLLGMVKIWSNQKFIKKGSKSHGLVLTDLGLMELEKKYSSRSTSWLTVAIAELDEPRQRRGRRSARL